MNIDRKYVNTIPFNTDKSRMLRMLPMGSSGLNTLLYVSTRRRGSIPKIMLVNNYERKVDSVEDLIPIKIESKINTLDLKPDGVFIKWSDLVALKFWIEDNFDLLLKYWECEIDYKSFCSQIFERKLQKDRKLKEEGIAKENEKERMARNRKMCYGKRAYSTLEYARKAVKTCNRERNTKTYIYMCPLCGQYHLTSHPQEGTLYVN